MRILIVEKEPEISNFIKNGLNAESFAIDVADCGEKCLNVVFVNEYDLIILDLDLPGINGLDVCKKIREKNIFFPIIVLSGKNEPSSKVEALNIGADDCMSKPFSVEELLARIRALLRRERHFFGGMSNKLKIFDLETDLRSRRVTRAGKEIYLNKKEFMLLEYLMRNEGVVLSRSAILENVWNASVDPFTNTVDVHINFLRGKIDKNFKVKLIHTVHGSGYKMEVST